MLMRRTRGLFALVVLCGLVLSAACAPGGGNASGQTGKRGGTLIRVITADPATLNPALTTGPALQVACKIFEGLVRLDAKYEVKPSLAESWDVTDDGLKYTFHLRKGVTWHDGKPFTSADVKWTFENVTSKYAPRASKAFERVDSIATPDDHTLVVTMKKRYGVLLTLLTCNNAAILPQHVYGDGTSITDHPRNTDDPIGTGPFKFESWKHGQAINLVRNDKYWRAKEGMPYLDRLVERIITDQDSVTSAVLSGEVDVVNDPALDRAAYQRLIDRPDLQGRDETDVPGNSLLVLNTKQKPFDDVRVRQAVFHAIDREFIVKSVFFGKGSPGKSAIDSRLDWAHDPEVDYNEIYAHDASKATALLDRAGYTPDAKGVRFTIDLPYDSAHPQFPGIAQVIRENLKQVGIAVTLHPLEASVAEERVFSAHDFDATIQSYTTAGDPAVGIERLYLTSAIGKQPFTNASGYSNKKVDDLFAKGAAATTHEDRARYYREVQHVIAEDVPTLVLVENPSADVVGSKVKGMWHGPDYFDWWEEVYLEK